MALPELDLLVSDLVVTVRGEAPPAATDVSLLEAP